MSIDTQLEYLSDAVEEQEPPISKQEMEQMLLGVQKSKEMKTYRQVDEAPVVVDVVDISDAAAKKLAQKLKPESNDTPSVVMDEKDESPGFLSKILDFAKGSFVNIIKMIGGVVGWVVGTITSVISGVTNWVLGRIQKAMLFSIAKSATNMGGRFSKLGLLVKAAGAASAGLAMYNVYDGISTFQSKLDSVNDVAASAFSDPESILTTGMTDLPTIPTAEGQSTGESIQTDQTDSSTSSTSLESSDDQLLDQLESSTIDTDIITDTPITSSQQSTPILEQPISTTASPQELIQPVANDQSTNIPQTDNMSAPSVVVSNEIDPLDTITSNQDSETKQVREFIELNNMFDDKSESVVNDMRQILNDTQANIQTNADSSTGSGSTINLNATNTSPSTESVNNVSPLRVDDNSLNVTDNITANTSDTSSQDVELYNDIKNKTSDITNTLQQKINNPGNKSSTSISVSPSVSSTGSTLNLQPMTPPAGGSTPASNIDTSRTTMNNASQLNTNTTNLQKTSVELSTKIEQLNKQVNSKQSPKIVNIDNTQTASSSDYLTDSDTMRAMARTRL